MDGTVNHGVLRNVADLPDPRAHNVRHRLPGLLPIAVAQQLRCDRTPGAWCANSRADRLSDSRIGPPMLETIGLHTGLLDPARNQRAGKVPK